MCRVSFLIFVLTALAPVCAEDWPQFRGPRGDGRWSGANLPEQWPADGLKPRWKREIGGGYAGISVVGDRVYTMDRQKEPTERERVLCFDAKTGDLVWEHADAVTYENLDYGNGPRAQPTVHDGRVYTVGTLGQVNCLDAASGKVLWRKHYQTDFHGRLPMWGYAGSPVIHGDMVLLAPGGPQTGLVAVDRLTGREIWRTLSDEAGYCTPLVIERPGGHRVVHWTPSHIRCVDLQTGEPLWAIPYEVTYGVSIAKPVVVGDLVIVAGYWEGSKAIRMDSTASQAELAWEENRYLRGLMSQPLVRDGYVYLLDKQYGLTCFEAQTGKKVWDDDNAMTPRGRNPQATLVWLGDENRAIILNAEGELILARLSPEGYDEQSRTKIIGFTWAHPAYAGDCVYARSDTELVCLPLK